MPTIFRTESYTTLAIEIRPATARHVEVTDESVTLELDDGRTISAPIAWYPRLLHATPEERNNWRLIGKGEGVCWPDLDEDISVDNILFGKPSGESQHSLAQWLSARQERL